MSAFNPAELQRAIAWTVYRRQSGRVRILTPEQCVADLGWRPNGNPDRLRFFDRQDRPRNCSESLIERTRMRHQPVPVFLVRADFLDIEDVEFEAATFDLSVADAGFAVHQTDGSRGVPQCPYYRADGSVVQMTESWPFGVIKRYDDGKVVHSRKFEIEVTRSGETSAVSQEFLLQRPADSEALAIDLPKAVPFGLLEDGRFVAEGSRPSPPPDRADDIPTRNPIGTLTEPAVERPRADDGDGRHIKPSVI